MSKKKHAYIASGEIPFVICGFAPKAADALKVVAKKIAEFDDNSVVLLAINTQIDEDGVYCVSAVLSELAV